MRYRFWSMFSFIILTAFLAGCASTVPTAHIDAFGQSTKSISDKIDAVLITYIDAKVAEELETIAQEDTSPPPPLTFANLKRLEPFTTKDAIKGLAVTRANKALGAYGASLSNLAKAGNQVDIDLATANLYSSLRSLDEQYKILADTDSGVFGDNLPSIAQAVAIVGNIYTEHKKWEAVSKIVQSSNEPILEITDAIEKTLDKDEVISSALRRYNHIKVQGMINDYQDTFHKLDRTARLKKLNAIYEAYTLFLASNLQIQEASKAVKAIRTAHNELVTELNKPQTEIEAIQAIIIKVQAYDKHYDNFYDLLNSCTTEIIKDPEKQGTLKCKESKPTENEA